MTDRRDGAFHPESYPEPFAPHPDGGGWRGQSESRRMPSAPGQSGMRAQPGPRKPGPRDPGASGSQRRPDASRRTLGDVPQLPSASRRLPAMPPGSQLPPGALIRQETTRIPATIAPRHPHRSGRALVPSMAVVLTVLVTLAFGATHALRSGNADANANTTARSTTPVGQDTTQDTPAPSGSAPRSVWAASAGAVVYVPPPPTPKPSSADNGTSLNYGIQPCHDKVIFPAHISQWTVPNGCYANVYVPNPANYPARPIFGYCNWWVRENHLSNYNITMGTQVYLGTTPAPGDAIFFDGGVQGASAEGHWAEVVAVAPDHYWFMLGEMNFAWRGAGFAKIDYRYAHVGPGVRFYR